MLQKSKQRLIIFAKAPIPGECKTRLIPLLGETASAELYKQLSIHCLSQFNETCEADILLQVYPDTSHAFIKQLKQQFNTSLSAQIGNNLGDRMFHAICESLESYNQCVLIGTDCPEIDSAYVNQAFTALQSSDIVLGPADDGGYVLIGANKIRPELFQDIEWSTENVLQQQVSNCIKHNYSYQLLATLWDLDQPQDYIQHQQRLKQLAIL